MITSDLSSIFFLLSFNKTILFHHLLALCHQAEKDYWDLVTAERLARENGISKDSLNNEWENKFLKFDE